MNKIKYLQTIGVIGLGIMGGMMAEALCAAGYKVVGYDPVAAARARLKKAGGRPLASATAVAATADIVITSLAKASVLEDVTAKICAAKRRKSQAPLIVIETSTLTIADKERAQMALALAGAQTLDCPISGTAVRMREGGWTIFASGPQTVFKRVKPVLDVFTKNVQFRRRLRQRHQDEIHRQPSGGDLQRRRGREHDVCTQDETRSTAGVGPVFIQPGAG